LFKIECVLYYLNNQNIYYLLIYSFQVEILAKKYEDKYKQVGDLSSKLTTEEATFRDIQVQ